MKLKNSLKGHMSREEVDQVIVMQGGHILFWGAPEALLKPRPLMKENAKKLLNTEVKSVKNFNNERFIYEVWV
ncbi:MAG: hypothetical protein Q4B15_07885 [Lachnospiraceae bacterium]|nr:hypothetical protein [Lachnospiraceae bacterium]